MFVFFSSTLSSHMVDAGEGERVSTQPKIRANMKYSKNLDFPIYLMVHNSSLFMSKTLFNYIHLCYRARKQKLLFSLFACWHIICSYVSQPPALALVACWCMVCGVCVCARVRVNTALILQLANVDVVQKR